MLSEQDHLGQLMEYIYDKKFTIGAAHETVDGRYVVLICRNVEGLEYIEEQCYGDTFHDCLIESIEFINSVK